LSFPILWEFGNSGTKYINHV
jgi:hypothetical protein